MRLERQYLNAMLFFLIIAAGAIFGCAGQPICEKITDPHVGFQSECSIDQWRMLRAEYARLNPSDTGGRDSIFKMDELYKPILFAHRGGALEAPESTLKAFDYTLDRDKRELLLFSEFLQTYPKAPLNIELKQSFLKKLGDRDDLDDNIKEFFKILDEYGGNRTIIITSANGNIYFTDAAEGTLYRIRRTKDNSLAQQEETLL